MRQLRDPNGPGKAAPPGITLDDRVEAINLMITSSRKEQQRFLHELHRIDNELLSVAEGHRNVGSKVAWWSLVGAAWWGVSIAASISSWWSPWLLAPYAVTLVFSVAVASLWDLYRSQKKLLSALRQNKSVYTVRGIVEGEVVAQLERRRDAVLNGLPDPGYSDTRRDATLRTLMPFGVSRR